MSDTEKDIAFTSFIDMSLRDYFAAAAMGGIVKCTNGLWNNDQAAAEAYVYADAMLKAREASDVDSSDHRVDSE